MKVLGVGLPKDEAQGSGGEAEMREQLLAFVDPKDPRTQVIGL